MFSRFAIPIQLKASAAAAVLLICLLALGTNAYLTSTRSAAGLRSLSQDLLEKRQAFAAVSDAAVATHMKIFRYVSWGSNGVSSKLLKPLYEEINGDLRAMGDRIAELAGRNDLSGPERDELEQLLVKWQDCARKAQDTIEVGQTDAPMATMMLSETDDGFKAIDTDLQTMSLTIAAEEYQLSNRLYVAAQRNKLIIIIGTLGGLLVSVLVTVGVGRSIVGPIRDITGVMQRLSAGETDVDIGHRERGDEIGQMVEAIAVFQRTITERHAREQALTKELRDALDQQTATAEVLQVIINSSQGDLEPVFDVLLERATRLCGADFAAIAIRDGDLFRYVAAHGTTDEVLALLRNHKIVPGRGTIAGRVLLEGRVVQIADCAADPEYEATRVATLAGSRTALGVPLLREDQVVGTIALLRQRVEAYTEAQIELVRGFGSQAVIALENARLLDEIRQRQAELRVTFDNMDHGVAMFDPELRLAAWNRNFQAILDLPEAFLDQSMAYVDFVRQLAERGEFGAEADPAAEVARHVRNADRHFAFERT
jgi:PAS domain-containing protein